MQADGVWGMNHLAYNGYMASLLPRRKYSSLQKALRAYVTDVLEECNTAFAAAWEIGGGSMWGQGSSSPHRGTEHLYPPIHCPQTPLRLHQIVCLV